MLLNIKRDYYKILLSDNSGGSTEELSKSAASYAKKEFESPGMLVMASGLDTDGETIVNTIINSIQVGYTPLKTTGNRITGGISVYILVADFSDILGLDVATITTEKGQKLPWLQWLLTQGGRIIIDDYSVKMKPGRGRSGQAIMVQNGNSWNVPRAHAGTIEDNWLTRALLDPNNGYLATLRNIVYNEISRSI